MPERRAPEDILAQAEGLIRRRNFASAARLLQGLPDPRARALMGDVHFLQGQYRQAETAYRAALGTQSNTDWEAKATHAAQNAFVGAGEALPGPELFHKHMGLAEKGTEPRLSSPELSPPKPPEKETPLHAVRQKVGGALSNVAGDALHALSEAVGRTGVADEIWTNWYRDIKGAPESFDEAKAIFKLAYMRKELFENNLIRTYPNHAFTGFFDSHGEGPPAWALRARTDDGSWNWLPRDEKGERVTGRDPRHDPLVGAAFTRFYRNVGDDKGVGSTFGAEKPGTKPVNVLTVSHRLLTREGPMKEVPFLNLSAAAWIQFQNHDWVSHGENRSDEIDWVPIPPDHPARKQFPIDAMPVHRSYPDPTRTPGEARKPHAYLNEVTHWWDGSQIYGSDRATVRSLRTDPSGAVEPHGKLYLPNDGLLPKDSSGMERSGFTRNWWLGLSMFHTLFAHEHNAICDMLRAAYPRMPGDELFLKARLINAATMAKIHTIEWTPAILPNPALYKGMRANWYGLITDLFHHETHPKALEAIRMESKELGGIVGNPLATMEKYGLSEEFVAVYRLHSLLPDSIPVKVGPLGHPTRTEEVPLAGTRLRGARPLMERYGPATLWSSFGAAHPGQLVLNNFPRTLQNLTLPGQPFVDLGAIDLYRDRERGVPPYNQLRRELGLKPIRTFDDLGPDPEQAKALREVYGRRGGKDNVEDIDLLIGTLAEAYRPTGFGFGETLFQVFILNASWRLIGDRFYTDDYRPEIYTPEGIAWLDEVDFKSVLLRHHPGLAATGLGNIRNAFEPWDEGKLDLSRHPLRAFDKSLQGDPTKGERGR